MIKFLSALTGEAQFCVILALVLLIMLASGIIGYQMGWQRCIEYLERVL